MTITAAEVRAAEGRYALVRFTFTDWCGQRSDGTTAGVVTNGSGPLSGLTFRVTVGDAGLMLRLVEVVSLEVLPEGELFRYSDDGSDPVFVLAVDAVEQECSVIVLEGPGIGSRLTVNRSSLRPPLPTAAVVDTTDGYVWTHDRHNAPFTLETAEDFARTRNDSYLPVDFGPRFVVLTMSPR